MTSTNRWGVEYTFEGEKSGYRYLLAVGGAKSVQGERTNTDELERGQPHNHSCLDLFWDHQLLSILGSLYLGTELPGSRREIETGRSHGEE